MKELELCLTHYKILDTIKWLNDNHLYATALGVYKIIHGDLDEDTVNLQECPTFSVITSYGSKKVCRYLLALYRYGYIIKVFDKKSNTLYYSVTLKGRNALEQFHKKHPQPYKKMKKRFTPQIVEIIK